ncbi:AraC family transcriptional regulator [Clostridiaceae bacterium M8S5]|nr:AraC family transcriptional regulator [Clostridiaceae bacterium M8S5]
MNYDINEIIESFTNASFKVKGVYYYKVPPKKEGLQKSAPYPGLLFPLGGKAQFTFNGTPYITNSLKVIHGGANMDLGKKVLGNNDLTYISVMYDINQKTKGIYLPNADFEITVGQSPRLKGLLHRLWKTYYELGPMSAFQVETLFRCSLEEMFVGARSQMLGGDKSTFSKISYYIHENYDNQLSVGELAEMFEMNTNRLYYIFMKHAGIGPGDYIIAYRLNRAKELLYTTDLPINNIADAIGYNDPLYFSRLFKKRFGLSPSKIRNTYS